MQPNQKIKFIDWYMKIDPPMWIAADLECMNIPIIDNDNNNDNVNDNDNDNDDKNLMLMITITMVLQISCL